MKNKSTFIFIVILLILVVLLGYNYYKRPFYKELTAEQIAQINEQQNQEEPTPTPNAKKDFFESMSAEEKINQILMYPISPDTSEDEEAWIIENKPGFMLFFGKKVSSQLAKDTIDDLRSLYADDYLQPIVAVDHEGGTVQRLSGDGFTSLPSWQDMCGEESKKTIELYDASASEISNVGVNVVFAPVLDIAKKHPALKSRVCDDPEELKAVTDIYITSFSKASIMPVIKHFPGIGSTTKDLHTSHDVVTLTTQDTDIFKTVLDSFPNIGLMISHVSIADVVNGPCSLSSVCIGKLPIQYPEVILFTDALEMESARYEVNSDELKPLSQVAVEAVYAGNTILVFGEKVSLTDFSEIQKELYNEYNDSSEFREKVDTSVQKILDIKKL